MKNRLAAAAAYLPPLALLALLLALPKAAAEGARGGLSVCAQVIVPSLFPFLFLSSLLGTLGLPAAMAGRVGPLLARLGLPGESAAPFLLGLCGGYPVGARAVAELVKNGAVTSEEGSRMLPWCANTGPGFIIGVTGSAVFASVRAGVLLYICHILAALTLAVFSRGKGPRRTVQARGLPAPAGFAALPACIGEAVSATLDVCGCVVLFSTLAALLQGSGVFSALAGALSRLTGEETRWAIALLTGLLEPGSGIAALRGMAPDRTNLALAAFLLGFGGLSVHAQTLYAVAGTKIRCARHFAGRIVHGLLSAVYLLALLAAFRLPRI